MIKIGKKIDGILDAVFGSKIKGRWIKILVSIAFLISFIGLQIFLSTNLGYNKKSGFFLKPWNVNFDIKKDIK